MGRPPLQYIIWHYITFQNMTSHDIAVHYIQMYKFKCNGDYNTLYGVIVHGFALHYNTSQDIAVYYIIL